MPTHIELLADWSERGLVADGADWVRVYAHISDSRSTTFPYSDDLVTFAVSGTSHIIKLVGTRWF